MLLADRSVQLKAAFGEEVQVAPEVSPSISKGTNIMEAEETSTTALTYEGLIGVLAPTTFICSSKTHTYIYIYQSGEVVSSCSCQNCDHPVLRCQVTAVQLKMKTLVTVHQKTTPMIHKV